MYDVIIKYLRDFSRCLPLIPSIFILLFNYYLITNTKFIEIEGKIGVLRFSEYLGNLKKPFSGPQKPKFYNIDPLFFHMLYNIIVYLSMKFGGYKSKIKDFMVYRYHFRSFSKFEENHVFPEWKIF